MSYDFYIKHIMHAIEWKFKAMINKNKKLINIFKGNWRHPLNRKLSCLIIVQLLILCSHVFKKYSYTYSYKCTIFL